MFKRGIRRTEKTVLLVNTGDFNSVFIHLSGIGNISVRKEIVNFSVFSDAGDFFCEAYVIIITKENIFTYGIFTKFVSVFVNVMNGNVCFGLNFTVKVNGNDCGRI